MQHCVLRVRSRSPLSFFPHSTRSGPTPTSMPLPTVPSRRASPASSTANPTPTSTQLPTAPSRGVFPPSAASNPHQATSGNRSESIHSFNNLAIPVNRTHRCPETLLRNPRFVFAIDSALSSWEIPGDGHEGHCNTYPTCLISSTIEKLSQNQTRSRIGCPFFHERARR